MTLVRVLWSMIGPVFIDHLTGLVQEYVLLAPPSLLLHAPHYLLILSRTITQICVHRHALTLTEVSTSFPNSQGKFAAITHKQSESGFRVTQTPKQTKHVSVPPRRAFSVFTKFEEWQIGSYLTRELSFISSSEPYLWDISSTLLANLGFLTIIYNLRQLRT